MSTTVGNEVSAAAVDQLVARARKAPCNCGCGCSDASGLERVRFFPRQLLGADDLTTEQTYFREKLRRHNRYLHGWGVVCGCAVKPAPTEAKPYQVLICPGYVVTPCGDEIMICEPALFDLATCIVSSDDPCAYSRPCPPVTTATPLRQLLYLSVCYKECIVRPVRVAPAGCSCDDAECDYSRIRDAYEFACLDQLPSTHQDPPYTCDDLCAGGVFPCPPPPDSNCVVLATIRLREQKQDVANDDVGKFLNPALLIDDTRDRRLLYSTAMVQQLALCQCGGQEQVPIGQPPQIDGQIEQPG